MNELAALLEFEAVRQCVFQCVPVCSAVCVAVCVAACVAVLHLVFSVLQRVAVCYMPPNFDCGMQRFSIEAHVSLYIVCIFFLQAPQCIVSQPHVC